MLESVEGSNAADVNSGSYAYAAQKREVVEKFVSSAREFNYAECFGFLLKIKSRRYFLSRQV